MAETWLTYSELGAALGITAEAVRQKAIRARWPRQRDNMGKAQVLVDVEDVRATLKPPRERVSDTRDERVSDACVIEALQEHIATLKEAVAKAEAAGEQRREECEAARKQVDAMVAELAEMARRMADQAAAMDKVRGEANRTGGELAEMARQMADQVTITGRVRAELATYRSRPLWRRLVG
jgi:chromosome segregation ATPase